MKFERNVESIAFAYETDAIDTHKFVNNMGDAKCSRKHMTFS